MAFDKAAKPVLMREKDTFQSFGEHISPDRIPVRDGLGFALARPVLPVELG